MAWLLFENLTEFLSNYQYLTNIHTNFCHVILHSTRAVIFFVKKYVCRLLDSLAWNDNLFLFNYGFQLWFSYILVAPALSFEESLPN